MTYVIVGFKVKNLKSIHYSVASTPEDMVRDVLKAFSKGAEFISLRRIP